MVLEFVQEILADLKVDGMLVLAPGLGVEMVLRHLIAMYSTGGPLLVLNTSSDVEAWLIESIEADPPPLPAPLPTLMPPAADPFPAAPSAFLTVPGAPSPSSASGSSTSPSHAGAIFASTEASTVAAPLVVDNETPASQRTSLYARPGCLFVRSRILIVDMLAKRVPLELIAGIIVADAHSIKPTSQVAFIVKLFRESNKTAFIKAVTDNPVALTQGYRQAEKTLKALHLERMYIWPRFHTTVAASLVSRPEVVEVREHMTATMRQIQDGIVKAMAACLQELKESTVVDLSAFSVKDGVHRSFDVAIRAALDPVWHKASPKTKQLVQDLELLRRLSGYLISYDCVTFYQFLESFAESLEANSRLMFLEPTQRIFRISRERIYHICIGPKPVATRQEVRQYTVDEEIITSSHETAHVPDPPNLRNAGTVDRKPIFTLEDGSELEIKTEINPKFSILLRILKEIRTVSAADEARVRPVIILCKDDFTAAYLRDVLVQGADVVINARLVSYFEHKIAAMSSGYKRSASITSDEEKTLGFSEPASRNPKGSKLKKPVQAATSGSLPSHQALLTELATPANLAPQDVGPNGKKESSECKLMRKFIEWHRSMKAEGAVEAAQMGKPFLPIRNDHIVIFPKSSCLSLLNEVKPNFVILFDPDVEAVRQIEVFKAEHPGHPVRVYFSVYSDSIEELRYANKLEKETNSFKNLIETKSTMAIAKRADVEEDDVPDTGPKTSRKGGANLLPLAKRRKIIVDVREFRSTLPSLLYDDNVDLVPVTLSVADYILSPKMCVERKSISDLFGSLSNGRLYTQAESMCRNYECPIVLIEFDEDKSFSLQSSRAILPQILDNSIVSKLVLLTLHFPRLRYLWCRSPHATVDSFKLLKEHQEEPDEDSATKVGLADEDSRLSYMNVAAKEFMLKLPGVNQSNCFLLVKEFTNLAIVSKASLGQLQAVLGPKNGKDLFDFFHHDFKPAT